MKLPQISFFFKNISGGHVIFVGPLSDFWCLSRVSKTRQPNRLCTMDTYLLLQVLVGLEPRRQHVWQTRWPFEPLRLGTCTDILKHYQMQVVDNYLKYLQNHTKVITNVFLIFWITMLQITKQKKDVQVNEFVLLNLEQQKCVYLCLQGCHTPIKAKCFQNFSCAFILASKYNFYPTTTAHTEIYRYQYTLKTTIPNAAEPVAKTSFHYWVVPKIKICFKAKRL